MSDRQEADAARLRWRFAPASGWLPGFGLRFVILGLVYASLTFALTINYVASITLFSLALIGMYVGFRRGFVRGLTRAEKILLLAFAAYPAVAIFSYLFGTQTNLGFRFLGRDLRFLLFIPAYLAVRWARPRAEHGGWALTAGALAALGSALVGVALRGFGYRAHGVAGVAISFGDLALLSGFLGAALLLGSDGRRFSQFRLAGALLGIFAGVAASVLSGSRGGWIAIPILLVLLFVASRDRQGRILLSSATALLLLLLIATLAVPGSPVRIRIVDGWRDARAYLESAHLPAVDAAGHQRVCVNNLPFMRQLARIIELAPQSSHGLLGIVNDAGKLRTAGWLQRCLSGYVYRVHVPADARRTTVVVPRSLRRSGQQEIAFLARGDGAIEAVWKGRQTPIASGEYRVFRAFGRTGPLSPAYLLLRPGKTLYFLPLQLVYGEYTFVPTENGVGERFALWDAAWQEFVEHPILGVGTGAFAAEAQRLVKERRVPPVVWRYEHAHSDFLNQLGNNGVLGLLVLLGLYAGIAWALASSLRCVAAYGWMLSLAMTIFGLTETMFVHSLVISWFVVVTALGLAVAVGKEPDRELAA